MSPVNIYVHHATTTTTTTTNHHHNNHNNHNNTNNNTDGGGGVQVYDALGAACKLSAKRVYTFQMARYTNG